MSVTICIWLTRNRYSNIKFVVSDILSKTTDKTLAKNSGIFKSIQHQKHYDDNEDLESTYLHEIVQHETLCV